MQPERHMRHRGESGAIGTLTRCMSTMRSFGAIVLLLVTFAAPGVARAGQRANKPIDPACAALMRKQQQHTKQGQQGADAAAAAGAAAETPSIVSAPPSAAPPVADPGPPGAVRVPAPALPSDRVNREIALAQACAEQQQANTDARFMAMARKHPTMVKVFSRINTSEPGWNLRADVIVDGSGIAGGGAYRKALADKQTSFDMMAMFSVRNYLLAQAGFTHAMVDETHLSLIAAVRHESFPEEDFYGLGRDSLSQAHTAYWRQSVDSIGGVTFSPTSTLHVSGTAGLLNVRLLDGRQEHVPTVQDLFTSADAPGLRMHTFDNFLHIGAGVDIDRTDNPIFPRGGRYRGSFTVYKPLDDALGTFSRIDIDLRHYQPIPRTERHVVAVRALIEAIESPTDTVIPFYFLPRLGGGTTLRAYPTSRWTDRNALAFNTEYRWLMTDRIQLIALADLGDVAPSFSALRPSKFHVSKGGGVRYHIAGTFLAGVDAAHGSEGWTVIARMGQAF